MQRIRSGANLMKLFTVVIYHFRTKIECLLDKAGKVYQRQTLELITKISKLRTKSFITLGLIGVYVIKLFYVVIY